MTAQAPKSGVLHCTVAGAPHLLPAAAIAEIIRPLKLTRVPHAPPCLLGLANVRGSAVPVVSLARLLGGEEPPASAAARTVLVVTGRGRVGLSVAATGALSSGADAMPLALDALLAEGFSGVATAQAARGPSAAPARPQEAVTADDVALLVMRLGGQDYALHLGDVVEVAPLPPAVAKLPGDDAVMLGAADWRGTTLPLVSLRALLGVPAGGAARRAHMVVALLHGATVGLVADGAASLLRVPRGAIDPVPSLLSRGRGEARISAICRLDQGRRLLLLLDPGSLFDEETANRLAAQGGVTAVRARDTGRAATEAFIRFRLGNETYGLPMAVVREVARRPDRLAKVRRAPAFLAGLMNVRGTTLPVIDQRVRFGADASVAARHVIIVEDAGRRAAICVDAVLGVLRAGAGELAPAPALSAEGPPVFDRLAGLEGEGHMTMLIDPATLMDQAARDLLATLAGEAAGAS
jgi:purine-binding chemotaxis protein CheW